MKSLLLSIYSTFFITTAWAQFSEIQLALLQDHAYTRAELFDGGYFTFSLASNTDILASGYYSLFSDDYLTSGFHQLPGMVDMIRVNDSLGYLLEMQPSCNWSAVNYYEGKVHQIAASFTTVAEWPLIDQTFFQERPRMQRVNDSLIMVFDSFSAQIVHLLSGEVNVFSFDDPFQNCKAMNDANNNVILYDSSTIYRFNALSGALTLLDTDSNLRSMVKTDLHTFRLYDNSVVQYVNYNEALATFEWPVTEVSTAELVVQDNVIHLMTDDAETHAKKIYFLNEQLNALNSVVLQDSDELNVQYFLVLSNRFFLAGFRQLHPSCRQVNFRYNNTMGELIEPRTDDISIDELQVSGISTVVSGMPNSYVLNVRGDVQVTVTNHSAVGITGYVLSWPRYSQGNGILPQCELGSGCRNFYPWQNIDPGESITLTYDNVNIGQFPPQSSGSTFQLPFCLTAHAPNYRIDKDQSNDTQCFQITNVVTDIEDIVLEAMGLQKQNGVWTAFGVREAQIELFDLTGRLLLRSFSTEDQFFLPEINEHTGISLVRITKGDEQLVQKLSGF